MGVKSGIFEGPNLIGRPIDVGGLTWKPIVWEYDI